VALASARAGVALPPSLVVVGEVGLSGELRRVSSSERREKEVAALGYTLARGSKELRPLLETYVKTGKKSVS
jgi:DNA repair protein RadA/Sms